MSSRDKRVDTCISKSREFAKPVLAHVRELVHKTYPEIEEDIKWGFPHMVYHDLVCFMAAFKEHCVFGFNNHLKMSDPGDFLGNRNEAMGQFGRIKNLSDLPQDHILRIKSSKP